MPINYGAWGAPATFANSLMEGLKESRQQQAMMAQKSQAQDVADSLEAQRLSGINTPEAKQRVQFLTAGLNARHAQPTQQPMNAQVEQPKEQVDQNVMGPTDAELKAPIGAVGSLPVGKGSTFGAGEADSGMSLKDESELARQKALQLNANGLKTKGLASGNQIPRGLATLLSKSGLTMQESNKIDSLPSAINIHKQIIDVIEAYGNNDPSVAQATVNKYIAQHPTVSPFFQSYKANPNNQAALYDALTRMGAIEQYKLQLGSQATPNEDAIKENQSMYPTLGEVAAKSPNVAQKLNALVDTTIRPAVEGPMNRISLMRDAQGNFPAPILGTIYNNLNGQIRGLEEKVKTLKGYSQQGGMMNIPAAQSGMPQDMKALAQQALNDPNATPEHKAAAQKILGGQ